jgi:DegV family protein with EDD domain
MPRRLPFIKRTEPVIKIIADTTCGLPLDLLASLEIPTLPQIIIFGASPYRDDGELDTPTFLKMLRESPVLPKTSAPEPALYTPIYQRLLDEGHTLLVLCPSVEVSGTYRSATIAAQDFPGAPIHIMDTRTLAGGLGRMVLVAHRMAQEGASLEQIIARMENMIRREQVYFIVDTLEYLYKGGRIGGARALFGSLLQIKPILTLRNGRVESFENQRTKKRAIARIQELVKEQSANHHDAMLTVCHCDALDEAEAMRDDLQASLGIADVPIFMAPPAIVVHCGPKLLEVMLYRPE